VSQRYEFNASAGNNNQPAPVCQVTTSVKIDSRIRKNPNAKPGRQEHDEHTRECQAYNDTVSFALLRHAFVTRAF